MVHYLPPGVAGRLPKECGGWRCQVADWRSPAMPWEPLQLKELGEGFWGSWKIGLGRQLNGHLVGRGSRIETTDQPNHCENIALDH